MARRRARRRATARRDCEAFVVPIRDLNENPSLRKKDIERILADAIDADGGPLLSGLTVSSADSSRNRLSEALHLTHRFPGRG